MEVSKMLRFTLQLILISKTVLDLLQRDIQLITPVSAIAVQ
jgi:hypothetical protein